ncbi:NAD(P)-dependent oxidoreductase [Phreatobacter stygius]|uniref:NAD(P)-dependent oxidoreductase n=1 Tax=Phreatobacter stygius TaxID=1940610 RepID=A0A4D7B984_9HYPH|nr:NAD(P)-dependent oxidoreductase [Phreatobacter stygius]QCI67465.1 NAD(P)-dependent oxidoreductase [Phreatobacter stygius]
MSTQEKKSVLIIGGSGLVGAQAAKTLRQLHPDLPITIGGRDLGKAEAVAKAVGLADAVAIDLGRPDLGQADGKAYGAVVMFLKDGGLNSLKFAQARGLPYLSISSGVFEVGPEMALYIHKPKSAPILMDSNWLAGAATFPVLHFAKEFRSIEAIEIAAVLDEQDMGGPAAHADFERLTTAAPHALILKQGQWLWSQGEDAARKFRTVDGMELQGQAYSPLDVLSLAGATDARSIRFDLVLGETASRRRGEPFSSEIVIEISGEKRDGTRGRERHEIVHPAGQAPLTALGVALGVERLLGLAGGAPVEPGLYLPEVLIEPDYFLRRLTEFGAIIRRA